MKKKYLYNTLLLLFTFANTISCANDDKKTTENTMLPTQLIGEWQRNDFNTNFEYKIKFNIDYTGLQTEFQAFPDGTQTSSAMEFTWSVENMELILDFDNETIHTSYFINDDGQLLLNDITNLHFNKID